MLFCACTLSHVGLFYDLVDCSPPGSSVHGISQARILEWVAISYSGNLPNPGIEPHLLHWLVGSLPLCHLRVPYKSIYNFKKWKFMSTYFKEGRFS